jgi:hypothetical protein
VRLKAAYPGIEHKSAFKMAAANWKTSRVFAADDTPTPEDAGEAIVKAARELTVEDMDPLTEDEAERIMSRVRNYKDANGISAQDLFDWLSLVRTPSVVSDPKVFAFMVSDDFLRSLLELVHYHYIDCKICGTEPEKYDKHGARKARFEEAKLYLEWVNKARMALGLRPGSIEK